MESVLAVIVNRLDVRVVDACITCFVKELLEDLLEFGGMSNLVAEDMGQFVQDDKKKHVVMIILAVLVAQTHVNFFLVDGV